MRAILTVLSDVLLHKVGCRGQSVTVPNEMVSFLDRVDSIQSRFSERLVTGQRDVLFPVEATKCKPETGEYHGSANADIRQKKPRDGLGLRWSVLRSLMRMRHGQRIFPAETENPRLASRETLVK